MNDRQKQKSERKNRARDKKEAEQEGERGKREEKVERGKSRERKKGQRARERTTNWPDKIKMDWGMRAQEHVFFCFA